MIGEWFAAVPALLVAAALLIVPGYAAARAARLGGLLAWAVAAPASLTVIGLASVVAPLIGMPWSIVPVLIVAVLVIVLQFTTELFMARHYGLAMVSFTPVILLMTQLAFPADPRLLLAERALETLIGACTGIAVVVLIRRRRPSAPAAFS